MDGSSRDERVEERLLEELRALGSVAVAFSGGVDSSVLLHAAVRALGERAVAVIADSPSLPRTELAEARRFATSIGARLRVVETRELEDARYVENRGDRCYFCKSALFDAMALVAEQEQAAALAFGEITDDFADDRPGARAARQRGVVAPLSACGLSKADVRAYARRHGLAAADKPASACLASRIPAGTAVSAERLARVERAEHELRGLGFRVLRVRDHDALARVEVGADELGAARALEGRVRELLRPLGFASLELAAYGVSAGRSAAAPGSSPAPGS